MKPREYRSGESEFTRANISRTGKKIEYGYYYLDKSVKKYRKGFVSSIFKVAAKLCWNMSFLLGVNKMEPWEHLKWDDLSLVKKIACKLIDYHDLFDEKSRIAFKDLVERRGLKALEIKPSSP